MSDEKLEWMHDARGLRFAIVVARFNSSITERLRQGAAEALANAANVDTFHVPGAFELPLAAKQLAVSGRYDAIVTLGAVVRGGTPHFDYVAGECARGVQQVMLDTSLPVAFGVLTTDTVQQAEDRAGGQHGNKGFDAAMTAIEMVRFGLRAAGRK
jgi:6,7-dimethyl-8-ribityllumazine synthase